MPEKKFSSWYGGHGEAVSQNQKHLDSLTEDELIDELSDMWDAMDENNYDPAKVDAYLAELEKRESDLPSFDADASLDAFQEKHARFIEQTMPVQFSTAVRPVHSRRWRTSLVAAIAAIIVMLGGMITAQAMGVDVFGAIARWTEETFHFDIASQISNNQKNNPAPVAGEYATLQDALDAYGISERVAPQWYPAELETAELSTTPRATGITIQAVYENPKKSLVISIRQYATAEDAQIGIGTFEKDANAVTQYERNGIIHYIFSNNSNYIATWTNGTLVCSVSGNMTLEELEQMIDSIYKG